MRRIVSLWLPQWPTERHRSRSQRAGRNNALPSSSSVAPDKTAFALVRREARGVRLYALNGLAAAAGLKPGMALTDARAMVPDLITAQADVATDTDDLHRLALWTMRFSPLVAIDNSASGEADALWLDVTGCTHLFGGEAAMLDELVTRLGHLGHVAQAAIAPTPGAAFALARAVPPRNASASRICVNPEETAAALAPLSVTLLRLGDDAVSDLTRFGLKRIGALQGLPRAALHARFDARGKLGKARGDMVLRRLDEALGIVDEPISPILPAPVLHLSHPFIEPVYDTGIIARALDIMLERLRPILERMGLGPRQVRLVVFRTDGCALHLDAATSAPSRETTHWRRLFAEKIEAIEAPFGVDIAALHVMAADPLEPSQHVLDAYRKKSARQSSLDQVVDRIANRFGAKHVLRSTERPSHLPERREHHASALYRAHAREHRGAPAAAPRPFRLFDHPEAIEVIAGVPNGPPMRFRWRRRLHAVARAQGPERIAPEWWRGEARLRDYYQVENVDGTRFWLYREGRYEDVDTQGPPCWFIHGLFM